MSAMEPAEMKKYLIPGLAVAAVIAVVGLLFGLGGPPPEPKPGHHGQPGAPAAGPIIKPGADISVMGMSETPPATVGPEWRILANGIKIWDVKEGDGETVGAGQRVSVQYSGWLTTGRVFDSSLKNLKYGKSDSPIEFSLNEVIPGWRDGIPGMKIGGIRRLFIPAAQGYGARGSPPDVPPNADLIFEVKLLGYQ